MKKRRNNPYTPPIENPFQLSFAGVGAVCEIGARAPLGDETDRSFS